MPQLGLPPLTDAQIAAMFPPDEAGQYPDRFIQKTEFTDGFGRLMQTRAQADDTILDDLGLTAEHDRRTGPCGTHQQDPAAPPQVVVSGWQTYDNKGRVVREVRAVLRHRLGLQAPGWQAAQRPARQGNHRYDPRGLAILTDLPGRDRSSGSCPASPPT